MDILVVKRSMRISAIAIIIASGNLMRIAASDNIRTVTALSCIALGAASGVFLVNFFQYLKLNKKT